MHSLIKSYIHKLNVLRYRHACIIVSPSYDVRVFCFLPQTPGRKRPPTGSTRRVLAEKNHDPSPDESVYSQANFSLASTGSYTDFQV